ncbi:hypothetical protein [Geodermatophilus sp. SYSU D01105]
MSGRRRSWRSRLNLSAHRAEAELERSLVLVHRLPRVLSALESGLLHAGHLWCLLEHVAPIAEDALRAAVEAELLAWMAGRSVTTPAQLGERVRRVVARHAARDAARELRERGISVRPEPVAGMAALTVVASVATLLGGDAPGEVDGQVVPTEMVRRLLRGLTGNDAATGSPAGEVALDGGLAAATADLPDGAGLLAGARPEPAGEQAGLARWWAEMERRVLAGELGGEPEWPPDPAPADPPGGSPPTDPPQARAEAGAGCEADPDWDADLVALTDPDPPADRDQPPPSSGWWVAADRAVEDAGAAVHAAAMALGHAQRLLHTAQAADAADEAAWTTGPGGQRTAAPDTLTALAAASAAPRGELAALLAATAGGLADRPRLALTDAVTGALAALTDLPGLRRAAHCGTRACRRRPDRCPTP